MIKIKEFRDLYEPTHGLSLYKMADVLGIKHHTLYKRANRDWLMCVQDGKTYMQSPVDSRTYTYNVDVLDVE